MISLNMPSRLPSFDTIGALGGTIVAFWLESGCLVVEDGLPVVL